MADIIKDLMPTESTEASIKALKMIQGSALLGINGFNEVMVLHNIAVLGPDLLQPTTKILVLYRAGSLAEGVKLHPVMFNRKRINLIAPQWNALKQATDANDILKMSAPEANAWHLKCKHLLPLIAPIIWTAIQQADTSDSATLIPLFSAMVQDFDWTSMNVKAQAHGSIHPVLYFLWAVTQEEVP